MPNYCYILYSPSLNKHYIGETNDIQRRLDWHNSHEFSGSFTAQTNDWELYYLIECQSRNQARKIESHIKKMKSKKYIENLKKYPGITERLLIKYQD